LEAAKKEEPSSSSCSSGEEACRGVPLRSQQSGGHGIGKLLEYQGMPPGDGNCKRKLSKQCGLCKLAQDGKMAMSEVTALKSAIETMATEMV
jgi:hypothetical protein